MGLGFGTWIWDLDFGLRFGNGLGLDNISSNKLSDLQNLYIRETGHNPSCWARRTNISVSLHKETGH